jgi:hypothetical protein
MSKTYRTNNSGRLTGDSGRHYAARRYRPGSRRKPHRVVARAVRREEPDLRRFGEAVLRAAMFESTVAKTADRQKHGVSASDGTRPLPSRPEGRP